ncbi:MAG: dethiobiotin synthase [Rhodospirillaceae bacterium]|jgi:dethiobiotin synthetase/malonyl-CoA O-methyltransferase|nr:dethiobiotin synthase [Rhodospirillaceae bacterium]
MTIGVFVTGTDTDVGKTVVSAWLVKSWNGDYWKPIQSGVKNGLDADLIRCVTPNAVIHSSSFLLNASLSPHLAAKLDNINIKLEDFNLPQTIRPLVVEGIGGVLVPINESNLTIDLINHLKLPTIVVAKSGLGTINHTLLTIKALQFRKIKIVGIIMSGQVNDENRQAIEHFSGISVIAQLPQLNVVVNDLIQYPPLILRPF